VTGVHWQPVIDTTAQGISGKNLTMISSKSLLLAWPLHEDTVVDVITSFLPLSSLDSTMKIVVPYMVYQEYKRPIEISPDTPANMLEPIASEYMGQPAKVIVSRYPIRDSDELVLVQESDSRMAHEVKLQELREADKSIPKPVVSTPPTMQQSLA
jgi:hypothetical protein